MGGFSTAIVVLRKKYSSYFGLFWRMCVDTNCVHKDDVYMAQFVSTHLNGESHVEPKLSEADRCEVDCIA